VRTDAVWLHLLTIAQLQSSKHAICNEVIGRRKDHLQIDRKSHSAMEFATKKCCDRKDRKTARFSLAIFGRASPELLLRRAV